MLKSQQELNELQNKIAIGVPTEEQLREYAEKTFLFLKDVIPGERFDKYIDRQIKKLNDDKIDGYDVAFSFLRSLLSFNK